MDQEFDINMENIVDETRADATNTKQQGSVAKKQLEKRIQRAHPGGRGDAEQVGSGRGPSRCGDSESRASPRGKQGERERTCLREKLRRMDE